MNKLDQFKNWMMGCPLISRQTQKRTSSSPSEVKSGPRYGRDYSLFEVYGSMGNALNISTVFRCVTLLSESVAKLPLQYLVFKDGIFQVDNKSRLQYLLEVQPNETINAFYFWTVVVKEMLLEGNAYILPMYNTLTMSVDRLVLLSRGSVTANETGTSYEVHDFLNGIEGVYDSDEIIHLMGKTFDGRHGVSVLSYARMATAISAAGDGQTLSNFENGGMVRAIVGNSDNGTQGFGEYQDSELEKTATDVDEQFRNGKRIVSIPGEVSFNQISMSSADMQFLDSRKFSVREICRFFGVHPSLVFDDTNNNYKDAENAKVAFLNNSLDPILRNIEIELRSKLCPPQLFSKRKIQYDREQINSCDLESRVNYQTKTIAAGIYTVNEWRKKENKPAVKGGEKVLVSANLKDINHLENPKHEG